MTYTAAIPEPPTALPAAEGLARDAAMLTDAAALALNLAQELTLLAVAVGKSGPPQKAAANLAAAGTAARHVERLLLAMRRCLALKDLLCRQHQEDGRQAEDRRDRRRAEIGERRRAVVQGVTRAIAALKLEASDGPDQDRRERLTNDLYDRVLVDERLLADLADTALPVELLIQGLCRDLGLAAAWIDTVRGTPGETTAKVAAWQESPYGLGRFRRIPAADIGLPEGQVYMLNTDTGAVFDEDGKVVKTLTDQLVPPESPPPDLGPGNTGPPDATAPPAAPDPAPAPGPPPRELTLAERAEADRQRRREALELARAENARVAERYRQRMIEADKQRS
jgi:hypothetical protein